MGAGTIPERLLSESGTNYSEYGTYIVRNDTYIKNFIKIGGEQIFIIISKFLVVETFLSVLTNGEKIIDYLH